MKDIKKTTELFFHVNLVSQRFISFPTFEFVNLLFVSKALEDELGISVYSSEYRFLPVDDPYFTLTTTSITAQRIRAILSVH